MLRIFTHIYHNATVVGNGRGALSDSSQWPGGLNTVIEDIIAMIISDAGFAKGRATLG
jgi:hypothetical protein